MTSSLARDEPGRRVPAWRRAQLRISLSQGATACAIKPLHPPSVVPARSLLDHTSADAGTCCTMSSVWTGDDLIPGIA